MRVSLFRLYRIIAAHPRLFLSSTIGTCVAGILLKFVAIDKITSLLIGWNVGAFLYIFLALKTFLTSEEMLIRKRAQIQSEGRLFVFTFSVLSALVGLFSTVVGVSHVRHMDESLRFFAMGLIVSTIVTSWFFTHTMFAQEYAHLYYRQIVHGKDGGLAFPGKDTPDYQDFLYFSFVIGTSGQTADISFTSHSMRQIGMIHCIIAFVFNTTVLALTINAAASLF